VIWGPPARTRVSGLFSFTARAIFAAFSTDAVVQLRPTYLGLSRRIASTVREKDRPREALSTMLAGNPASRRTAARLNMPKEGRLPMKGRR
jgi:hypothetical protein